MINQDFYKKQMEELFKLMGVATKQMYEMATVLYDKIKYNYTESDLRNATLAILEDEYTKLTGAIIMKYLNIKRSVRLEKEWKKDKEQAEKAIKDFWNSNNVETCINHKCYSCDIKYCNVIAQATLTAIKKMLNFSANNKSERRLYNMNILQELDKEFPGMGFNKEYWSRVMEPVSIKKRHDIVDEDFISEKEL